MNEVPISQNLRNLQFLTIKGIICMKGSRKSLKHRKYRPVIPDSIARSYTRTLHFSPKWFHQTSHQILKVIERDFFLINKDVVREEVGKCHPCLVNTHDLTTGQSFAKQVLPKRIRTDFSFDIVTGLPTTDSGCKTILLALRISQGI